jgi:phosphatidylglycerol---prolipoprotein diacylglyceryl transferase
MSGALAVIGWPVLDRIHIGGKFAISPHGLGIALGFLLGSWWMLREGPKRGVREEHISSMLFWALLGTIFGARFFYVIGHFSEFNSFTDMLKIYNGGISLLGGIAGAIAFAYPLMRKYGYRFLQVMDSAAIGLAFGIFVGRIGDLIIGDHLGKPTDVPWAFAYHGGQLSAFNCSGGVCVEDLVQGAQTLRISAGGARLTSSTGQLLGQGAGVHQTALYDFVIAFGLFLLLYLVMSRRPRREGVLIMTLAIWYGMGRVLTDFLRVDKRYFGLTGSQWGAAAVVALSVVVLTAWAIRARRGPPDARGDAEPGAVPTTQFVAPAEPGGGVAVSEPVRADAGGAAVVREVVNHDSPRDRMVVVGLAVLAVALVSLAAAVESYVPLLLVWAPQVAVLAWVSRGGRTGARPEDTGVQPPDRAVEAGEGTVPAR